MITNIDARYFRFTTYIIIYLLSFTSFGCAQENSVPNTAETLKSIVDVAASLCRSVPLEHIKQGAEGAVKADIENSFIGKFAGISAEGQAKIVREVTKGLKEDEFLAAVKDENSCRIAVFNKLAEKLVVQQGPDGGEIKYWRRQAKLVPYEVTNSAQLCAKIKSVIASAKRSFKGDIVKSSLGRGLKVILPNTSWCAVNDMPQVSGGSFPYYSCSFFSDEISVDTAYSVYAAYKDVISNCLGQEWITSSHERQTQNSSADDGAETTYRRNADDPSIRINTRDRPKGISFYIDISPPYTR